MWFLLLFVAITVRNSLGELQGPNVCTKTEQLSSTELLIGKPYEIKVCRDGMPNCKDTKTDNQPILKTQHQIRTRVITECCSGYEENYSKTGCVPISTTHCLFGEWANDKCNCQAGHYGKECNKKCPSGTYGPNCLSNCTCHNNATCNSDNGQCSCADGWTGTNCTEPCKSGKWGVRCSNLCHCHNSGLCNHIDGTCACTDGFVGQHCEMACPFEMVANQGKCRCKPGRTGVNCTEECTCGSQDENCNSEQPCLQALSWIKDYKNFWIFSIFSAFGLLTIFFIMINVVLRFRRVRFTVEETAPLHDAAFRDNPLYNPAKPTVCLIQHVYCEIQEDDRSTIYEKLDSLPPDNTQQIHYFNGRSLK